MSDRRSRMLGGTNLADELGLEIGALHAPLVGRGEGRVLYVDYASAETLRSNFRHPGDPADVVEVDIIWGDRPLRDCVGQPVGYVLASHVIEHVPDLIGWLLELHGALRPGGIVGLAIPDRRRTFDLRRPVSLPGEMVEAYLRRHRQPSLRQVFDAAALSKDTAEAEDWRPGESRCGLPAEVLRRLEPARDMVIRLAETPAYIDAHCWVFTPESFLDMAEALHRMGYFPFAVEGFHPTEPGSIEFQVRLRALDLADAGAPDTIAAARGLLDANATSAAEDTSRRMMAELATRNAALEAELAALQHSRSWRITAPLRAVRTLLRR